jgi:Ser/Thr protein kinase RdoA (MazF antagonist)
MASFGYEPGAQSDEPKQFRGYKVLKLRGDIPGEAQTFLVKKGNRRYVLNLYHVGKAPAENRREDALQKRPKYSLSDAA